MEENLKLLGQVSSRLKIFLRELFAFWNDNAARIIKKRYIDLINLVDTEILENFQKQQMHLLYLKTEILRLGEQIFGIEKISQEINLLSQKADDSIIKLTKNNDIEYKYLSSAQEKKKVSQSMIYQAKRL